MRILGVDPGLTRCGVGVVELDRTSRELRFVDVRVLRTSPSQEQPQRLLELGNGISELLQLHAPDAVAIERVFTQQNVRTVMGVAQVSGIVMFLAQQLQLPVFEYTPTQVKSSVSGYGAADKQQVTTMITRLLKLETAPTPADAADALAIAITHAFHEKSTPNTATARAGAQPADAAKTPAQLAWLAAQRRRKS